MATIIYDSTAKVGHNSEYIRHLILYISSKSDTREKYIFILNPIIINLIGKELLSSINVDEIIIIPIPAEVCSQIAIPDSLYERYKNSYVEADYINSQLLLFKALRLTFMVVDAEIFTMRRINSPFLIEITGIYLRPLPPICYATDFLYKRFVQSLKRIIKIHIIKFCLNVSKLRYIYILDDNSLIYYLEKIVRTTKFICLPDPFVKSNYSGGNTYSLLHKLGVNKEYFLAFGVMEPRKNILNIVKAFHAFTRSSTTPDISLLIIGKFVSAAYKREVSELIEQTFINQNISVIVHDHFIDDAERDLIIAGSKAVLMPYLNFQGSSGMLGHAVIHNKPAIVGSLGLVGELVNTYQLGIPVNPGDVNQIRSAMHRALTFRLNDELRALFLKTRTPANFSSILLGNLMIFCWIAVKYIYIYL